MEFFETIYLTLGPAQYDGAALLVAVVALMGLSMAAVMGGIAVASTSRYQRLPPAIFAVLCGAPSLLLTFAILRDTLAAFA